MDYSNFYLDKSFFEEEIRCDYKVTAKCKKIWAVQLELLNELLRVCHKYDIKVYAFAGTLLGAVRHKGYIPWDDDADVCMLSEDYNKLIEVAPKEFRHPFFLQTALTDRKYFFRYARLRNSNTTGLITGEESADYNNGIFLDIFLLNGYTNNEILLKKQLFEMKITWKACRAYIADIDKKQGIKKWIIGAAKKIENIFFKYETLVRWNNRVQGRYDKKAQRVTLLTNGKELMRKYWIDKKDLEEVIYVPFENIQLPIPKVYENFLTHAYGNYMEFPPVEERGIWHEDVITFDPDTPYKDFISKMVKDNENIQ